MTLLHAIIELSEPWDWDPPRVEVDIEEADALGGWPLRCVITSATDWGHPGQRSHPHLLHGSNALVGEMAELRLRHLFDTPPRLEDRPTVYLMVAVREIRPEPVLIGYGGLELQGTRP